MSDFGFQDRILNKIANRETSNQTTTADSSSAAGPTTTADATGTPDVDATETGNASSAVASQAGQAKEEQSGAEAGQANARDAANATNTPSEAQAESDDVSDLPLHLQERGKQLIEQKRQAREEANRLRNELETLKAEQTQSQQAQGGGATETDAGISAMPSAEGILTSDQLTQAQAEFEQMKANRANERADFWASLNQEIGAGEKSREEAIAALAEFDAQTVRGNQSVETLLENARLKSQVYHQSAAQRAEQAKAAITPLLEKYPNATADGIAYWVNQGADPEASAKYVHEQNTPLVEKAKADTAAAKDAELAEKDKEIARLKKLNANVAAASSGIGAGRGVAPSNGTTLPPADGFNYKDRVLAKIHGGTMGR